MPTSCSRARTPPTNLDDYAALTLREGSEISAIGVYSYFHLSALQKASRLAAEPQLAPAERAALARSMLADEAFALHFLQDVFAAGHIGGNLGRSLAAARHARLLQPQRPGSLHLGRRQQVRGADGRRLHARGGCPGARPRRCEPVSSRCWTSRPAGPAGRRLRTRRRHPRRPMPSTSAATTSCRRANRTLRALPQQRPFFAATLEQTPVPGLGPGFGAMPRFRSEVGPFIGLAGSIDGRVIDGGLSELQTRPGVHGGSRPLRSRRLRAGRGARRGRRRAGVCAPSACAPTLPRSIRFNENFPGSAGGNLSAAIPARTGLALRFRMPFYLVPGDLLLLSPLYLVDPKAYSKLAVTAGNGGLIPWQLGMGHGDRPLPVRARARTGHHLLRPGRSRPADRAALRCDGTGAHRQFQVNRL